MAEEVKEEDLHMEQSNENSTENVSSEEVNADPLEKALLEERAKVEELKEKIVRNQADFDNYRKRMMKEREDLAKYASRSLIEGLLPIIDNLERAIDASKQAGSFEVLAQGVEMVYRQLMDALKNEGAVPLETIGQPFDPYLHQAIAQESSDQHESGLILEEFQKGYVLKDKLIRPAMVKVTS